MRETQVRAAVELLDGGATVPFIARYRKEVTGTSTTPSCARSRSGCATCASWRSGGRPSWSRSARRASWTPPLEAQILAADSKARLEDIYLPLQAQAPDEGADRPGGRPRAAGRPAVRRPGHDRRRLRPAVRGRRPRCRRRRGRARRRPGDPRRAVRRGRRPDRRRCGSGCGRRAGWSPAVREGKEEAGAKFADYFDYDRALHLAALAPDPRDVPRREGGGPRPHPGPRAAPPGRGIAAAANGRAPAGRSRVRGEDRRAVRDRRPGPPGGPLAARHRRVGLAHPDPAAPGHRPAGPAAPGRRGRGGPGVRRQPA